MRRRRRRATRSSSVAKRQSTSRCRRSNATSVGDTTPRDNANMVWYLLRNSSKEYAEPHSLRADFSARRSDREMRWPGRENTRSSRWWAVRRCRSRDTAASRTRSLTHFSFTFTSLARCSAANNGVPDGAASHQPLLPVAARSHRHAMGKRRRRRDAPPRCSSSWA